MTKTFSEFVSVGVCTRMRVYVFVRVCTHTCIRSATSVHISELRGQGYYINAGLRIMEEALLNSEPSLQPRKKIFKHTEM